MGHYYDANGGSHFDATPSQAKAQGLLFSVNEQFKILAKPPLDMWKEAKLLEAVFNEPPHEGEPLDVFKRRARAARWRNTSGAATLGTEIHEGIEAVLTGSSLDDLPNSTRKYVEPAVTYVKDKGFVIEALEKVVVCMDHTFAGTADCLAQTANGLPFVLDFKSKKTVPGKSIQPYPENRWQLAAYAVAHYGEDRVTNHEVWGCNAFISTTEFGEDGLSRFEAYSYNPEAMAEAWETAKAIFDLHRRLVHDPRG